MKRTGTLIHAFVVYPLALLGGLVVLGIIAAVLLKDHREEIPPELICTPGYPCYDW